MPVILERAERSQRALLENLIQLYTHDFSEFWRNTPRGEIGEDGRFAPYPYLDQYWSEPARTAYIIRTKEGAVAGFALVNPETQSGLSADANIAEFFILRKYRRGGLGGAAAKALFAAHKGQWEIAVAEQNKVAQLFWRRVLTGAASAAVETIASTQDWRGPIFRFRPGS